MSAPDTMPMHIRLEQMLLDDAGEFARASRMSRPDAIRVLIKASLHHIANEGQHPNALEHIRTMAGRWDTDATYREQAAAEAAAE